MFTFSSDAEAAAADSAARLRELQGSGSPAVAVAAATAHELSLEKDTWSLLLLMNGVDKDDEVIREEETRRYGASRGVGNDNGDSDGELPGPDVSDDKVFYLMRTRDSEFRRTEAVVDWLQDATSARLDSLAPAEGVLRGGGLGWGRTLQSLAVGGGQKSEVAQMHPDANLRKVARGAGRHGSSGGGMDGDGGALEVVRLVGQDDLDEEELLRTVWVLVRSGNLKRAKDMCEDRGQPWRAAAMAGGAVVGPRDEREVDGGIYSPGQALWQEMCWKLRWVGGVGRVMAAPFCLHMCGACVDANRVYVAQRRGCQNECEALVFVGGWCNREVQYLAPIRELHMM